MPRKGRKTLDLPSMLIDKWMLNFQENKEDLRLMGITTFSGYMTKILNGLFEEGVVPRDLQKFLPP